MSFVLEEWRKYKYLPNKVKTFIWRTLNEWVSKPRIELIETDENGQPVIRRYTLREALEKAGGAQELLPRLQVLERLWDLAEIVPARRVRKTAKELKEDLEWLYGNEKGRKRLSKELEALLREDDS